MVSHQQDTRLILCSETILNRCASHNLAPFCLYQLLFLNPGKNLRIYSEIKRAPMSHKTLSRVFRMHFICVLFDKQNKCTNAHTQTRAHTAGIWCMFYSRFLFSFYRSSQQLKETGRPRTARSPQWA